MNKLGEKYFKSITDRTIKCKCGHSIVFAKSTKKVICSWCGKYVYRDPKEEFKERILKVK